MSIKINTLLKNIESLANKDNVSILLDFYNYLKEKDLSENHIQNNLKVMLDYVKYLDIVKLTEVHSRDQILLYLSTKIKNNSIDPDKRWITTWNHFLNRLKLFFRWLHNYHEKQILTHSSIHNTQIYEDWITPDFVKIRQKQTNRTSPYSETEIWEKEELLTIIKYEPVLRNKAIIALMWDLDARPHEITLLKIKHIRLRERYGEGEIPHQAKTGAGPILLTLSFPYVRDWLNDHPFKNEPDAKLICNLKTGAPISPKSLWNMMNLLKDRVIRLLESGQIVDDKEKQRLNDLLKSKKWNPYCIRHSAITADSDYLPEYALKKKVRWSMNSKQGSRYIKTRMGNDLKNQILEQNGIITQDNGNPRVLNVLCPRCEFVNIHENHYCSKCSYPLKPEAYDEIKNNEIEQIKRLEEKHIRDINELREELQNKFQILLSKIDIQKIT